MVTVQAKPPIKFTWSRFGGYECSSQADQRFSAMFARIPTDGRTIEEIYQGDVKGYCPGGTDWRLGKGKPPINGISREKLWGSYLALWWLWADANMHLMRELYLHAKANGNVLSDRYATTDINQARALAEILTELSNGATNGKEESNDRSGTSP